MKHSSTQSKPATQKYDEVKARRHDIIINNFLGGLAWALGTTVGLSVVVALAGLALRQISVIPILGNMVLQVEQFVAQKEQAE